MSYSDNNGQEPLHFLKTVVSQGSGQANKNGTDSDKENENKDLMTEATSSSSSIATKEYNFDISSQTAPSSKEQTMAANDSSMWDDFYNEDDFGGPKNGENSNSKDAEFDILISERRLDKVEEEGEDDYVDVSNATESQSRDNGDGKVSEDNRDGSDVNSSNTGSSKKKRKKRLFKRRAPPPLSPKSRTLQPIGGSHPNLSEGSRFSSRNDSLSSDQNGHLETMSETSGGERKLLRRKQVSRPRCAGPKPTGDRLQQKYQELEHLMLKPLPSPAVYVQQTRQQMLRLQGLNRQNHDVSHHLEAPMGLPPTGPQHVGPRDAEKVDRVIQIIDEDTNQVYSTMKTVHANRSNNSNNRNNRPNSAHPRRRPLSGQRQVVQKSRPQSAGQARPTTANGGGSEQNSLVLSSIPSNGNSERSSRGRKPAGNQTYKRKTRSDSSASGGSRKRSDRSESGSKDRERDYGSSSFEDGTDSRSASRSPGRAFQTTDNHLKNSSNPALRQWLKVKDKEYRQQKRDERKKKSKERAEKQDEEIKKQEFLKKAEEKVKEWMVQKRKEAWKQAKEARKRIKEEEKVIEQQIQHAESLRGKMFTPIKRPAGKYEGESKNTNQQQEENNAPTTPQPPKSKFVYKRPVSGRVRLMKLQQERKDDSKRIDEKKKEMEEVLEKEKERKMRMSYDQWLLKKREDDYLKRREAAKQRALAKSDPELDRIVPEMARRRIENIKRGKKRIGTGDSSIDRSMNRSFGGGDFGEEKENASPSYRLEVSGNKKSLKQRPSSAKNSSSINPKMSKSPRRPQSANPRVQALMNENDDLSANPDDSFKVPFPPELGVPKYVAAKQEKLFSAQVMENARASASTTGKDEVAWVDGGAKSAGENSEAKAKTGSDEIDAEAEYEPEMKIVADSLCTEGVEKETGEKNQSFFVTHGNLKIDKENGDAGGDDQTSECSTRKDAVSYNEIENSVIDASNFEKSDGDKDQAGSIESNDGNENKADDENKKPEDDEDGKVLNTGDSEVVLSEKDDESLIPPLDIGDDDYTEMKYEEEEDEEEGENQQETDRAVEEPNSADSYLLDNVEQVSESVELRSSIKHVSFSDEAIIHEDPLAGISNDDEYFYDFDDRAETDQGGGDEEVEGNEPDVADDDFECENMDEIEGCPDEAEDERGGYFDNDSARDDF